MVAIWKQTADTRGTQMIFCDMGVNPTPWGYCPYDEIVEKLVAHGVPRDQIAVVGDADTDAKKQALFDKVRQRGVRVLIGSTEDGHRHQRAEAAGRHCTTSTRRGSRPRSSSGTAASSARGTPTRRWPIYRYVTEGSVRRLHVAGAGDQGPVHRPGHDRASAACGGPRTWAARNSATPR